MSLCDTYTRGSAVFPAAVQAFKAVEVNSQVKGSSGDYCCADTQKHEETR